MDVHPLEAESTDYNKSVTELRKTAHDIIGMLDGSSPAHIPVHCASGSPSIEDI